MAYLLDTCVVSDLERGSRHPGLQAWYATVDVDELLVPAIAVAEICAGIQGLIRRGLVKQARDHERWLRGLQVTFTVVPFGVRAATVHGEIVGRVRHDGTPGFERDLMIAAIAVARGITVATRNIRHFAVIAEQYPALTVIDPYRDGTGAIRSPVRHALWQAARPFSLPHLSRQW